MTRTPPLPLGPIFLNLPGGIAEFEAQHASRQLKYDALDVDNYHRLNSERTTFSIAKIFGKMFFERMNVIIILV